MVFLVAALGLGVGGLASGQDRPGQPDRRAEGKPRSELEALRRENELLKLNLEVVLEKVRAQEAELRAFRGEAGAARDANRAADLLRRAQEAAKVRPDAPGAAERLADELKFEKLKLEQLDMIKKKTLLNELKNRQAVEEARRKAEFDRARALDRLAEEQAAARRKALGDPTADAVKLVEKALIALREARDPEAKRHAAEALEAALQRLRGQTGQGDGPPK